MGAVDEHERRAVPEQRRERERVEVDRRRGLARMTLSPRPDRRTLSRPRGEALRAVDQLPERGSLDGVKIPRVTVDRQAAIRSGSDVAYGRTSDYGRFEAHQACVTGGRGS